MCPTGLECNRHTYVQTHTQANTHHTPEQSILTIKDMIFIDRVIEKHYYRVTR